ncbi:RluA family pseudouridine synthase [Leptolyngbya iicbica]|uniref:RNA pseudouridylate synthase n=2 Tax=Cyanophyceae TaxID=3028117 RepID=A0A4Q7E3H1_9CYAN|nr:RluA family pseudouridine synthase [Leptolyngbya sp. LK]RZM74114.1 RluA family pseudouridine synthase [Leptolyngbya sp. LK]
MGLLHPVTDFVAGDRPLSPSPPDYWYEGRCPQTRQRLQLPRTAEAEAIARGLMSTLPAAIGELSEGKMIGVLLVATPAGERGVLKAFSGLLQGRATVAGWVPPIPGRDQVSLLELQTLRQLEQLKQAIIALQQLPERAKLAAQSQAFVAQLQALAQQHRQQKRDRDRRREQYAQTLIGDELAQTEAELVRQSQRDGGEKRRLKRQRDAVLAPLRSAIAQADAQIRELKHQRKGLSRQLQTQMHAAYSLTNFAGETTALEALWPTGLPTGTGDCAAPKLLHYAATHGLKPLALAEFWWGPAAGDKHPGQFYGACAERCQPIMGFLLSGLAPIATPPSVPDEPLPILFEDASLLVIDKPSGLLSVPGRTQALQDSVMSRLRCQRSDINYLAAVHRLDKGTSGILVLAKTEAAHRHLHQQFAHRQVQKAYEAILSAPVALPQGQIDLPLWRNPQDRPKTSVHFQLGKPSLTDYQVLAAGDRPRLHFIPHTGRTHQLRVHAAHPQGLNAPILGDTLYGAPDQTDRLHLHAKALQFQHPVTAERVALTSPVPF